MSLLSRLESILFVASKPLSYKQIGGVLAISEEEVASLVELLLQKWNHEESGVHLLVSEEKIQMCTNPKNAEVVDGLVQKEVSGELTRAQLETLTVVAYRGPLTRPEIEQIRGVNCSLIMRNLLMRGLVEERAKKGDLMPSYVLSVAALSVLGISQVSELPEYETLHAHEYLTQALESSIHDDL